MWGGAIETMKRDKEHVKGYCLFFCVLQTNARK
jgi:hypothetical protein